MDDELAVRARPSASDRSNDPSNRSADSGSRFAPHRKRARRAVRRDGYGAIFISPFVLALTLFMIVPIGYAIYESLYTTKLIGGTSYSGFANYREVFSSAQFWDGAKRVAVFAVVQVPLTIGIAAFFAAIFDAGVSRFGKLLRTIYFMPFAVPAVVASVMWSFLLLPHLGPFSRLANAIGFHNTNFFSTKLIVPTIIVMVIWEWTGYNMTILFTSLRAVPRTVTEAALLDGASLWTIIWRVKIPMVRPAIVMLCFVNAVGALQLFTEPQILAAFQPQAVSFGFTPSLYVYNTAIGSAEYNLGAAAAVVLGLLIGAVSIGSMALRRRSGEFA
ncbi:MAG: carbohydrate ABC transporter permease [Acidothermaceae bacterium]